jgi:hypothetical protein
MDKNQRLLALQAIDENCEDTTARQIIKWVMGMELNGSDTINPTNQYFAKKFGWKEKTVRDAIYRAKRSGFITTVGAKKSRTFELNVQFMKGKMAEIWTKRPVKKSLDFDNLPDVLPDNLPDAEQMLNVKVNANVNVKANNSDSINRIGVETRRVYDAFVTAFEKDPNTYQLTTKRKQKIKCRLDDAGVEMLLTAIEKTAADPFYRGDNDRGWVADLDFIIRSYEQVERLANKPPPKPREPEFNFEKYRI